MHGITDKNPSTMPSKNSNGVQIVIKEIQL
jgi:hypothetical protein